MKSAAWKDSHSLQNGFVMLRAKSQQNGQSIEIDVMAYDDGAGAHSRRHA
jgi:hypothetical protein